MAYRDALSAGVLRYPNGVDFPREWVREMPQRSVQSPGARHRSLKN